MQIGRRGWFTSSTVIHVTWNCASYLCSSVMSRCVLPASSPVVAVHCSSVQMFHLGLYRIAGLYHSVEYE